MIPLDAPPLVWLLPCVILLAALILGPLPIVARGLIRALAGRGFVHRWFWPVTLGLGLGLLGSVVVVATIDPSRALGAALLCLVFLLAIIDWQWRWLPIEWSVAVIALGMLFAAQSPQILPVLTQMAVPAAVLFALRQGMVWTTGKEALGLGDIWLLVGFGAFLSLFQSFLLIGFAAFSGLLEVGVRKLLDDSTAATRGVSFGAHMCLIFVIMVNF